jgi:chromosomal replication initiation ATPase DnaA
MRFPIETEEIIHQICEKHGFVFSELWELDRKPKKVLARQELMFVLREQGLSWELVGQCLCRDHTTVMHGYAAHKKRNGL